MDYDVKTALMKITYHVPYYEDRRYELLTL